ncbi:MAG: Ku protein [Longimicrobiales bacterium]|nr:Ku protein [Longimicrobiales bacterium]
MPEESRGGPSRSFWSGAISFGLVNVQVEFYPANRSSSSSLRMVDEEGTPLRFQYVCPEHESAVPAEEIVRGYETEDGGFVLVTDEELEALQPEKTREIDLQEFVPRKQLDPAYFRRGYFLGPADGSKKAYALLAAVMEEEGLAGIATFVMRGTEYLVAIVADRGILRAETMRFAPEIRSPADVGLPELQEAAESSVAAISAAIRADTRDELDESELRDRYAERLEALVQEKREEGDLVDVPSEVSGARSEQKIIDLMAALKASIEGAGEERKGPQRAPSRAPLEDRTRDQLYERAKELDIPGRSKMTKDELIDAIARSA